MKAVQAASNSKGTKPPPPLFKIGRETLNPFRSKGLIRYPSFVLSLVCILVFNLIATSLIHEQLLPIKQAADFQRLAMVYGIWFLLSILGYSLVSNTMIKRWATVWGQEDCPRWLRAMVRISLLSPIGIFFAFALVLLTSSSIPLFNGDATEPQKNIVIGWTLSFALALGLSITLAEGDVGAAQPAMMKSVHSLKGAQGPSAVKIPNDLLYRKTFLLLNPSLRYGLWVAFDFLRTNALEAAVNRTMDSALEGSSGFDLCNQRLGLAGVEVQDCYFYNLRKIGEVTPFVIPYFALLSESRYRKRITEQLDGRNPENALANAMVMVSNQMELLEAGPFSLDRRRLLQPGFLLKAVASPDVVVVEAGQDLGRLSVNDKILPLIETQLRAIELQLRLSRSKLGPHEIDIDAQMRDLRNRFNDLRRRPLLL